MYTQYVKRILDVLLSSIAFVVLSAVMIVVAILVRCEFGSPMIFSQERPGLGEKVFTLYKFRTMTSATDANGELLPDAQRLTALGKALRKYSLDELPELINIILGNMSIVGPRPLLVSYLPYYSQEERLRHTVRPGLSGLAQIYGRNSVSWNRRMAYDVEYVRHLSFFLDAKIVLTTIAQVLFKMSAVAEDTQKTEGNFAAQRLVELERQQTEVAH